MTPAAAVQNDLYEWPSPAGWSTRLARRSAAMRAPEVDQLRLRCVIQARTQRDARSPTRGGWELSPLGGSQRADHLLLRHHRQPPSSPEGERERSDSPNRGGRPRPIRSATLAPYGPAFIRLVRILAGVADLC